MDGAFDSAISRVRAVAGDVGGPELAARLGFLLELEALKGVLRRSPALGGERRENTAEHSWHLAMFALVLAPHSDQPVDLSRVVPMLLVHDVVEIDAGDTYIYDEEAHATKEARERAAADRLFGLLPGTDGERLRALWEEYERQDSADARFAHAVDRLQPLLLNWTSGGQSWQEHDIPSARVRDVNSRMATGSGELWRVASALIDEAVAAGMLSP
jgi:putative hydrolase of HD superfamily